MASFWSKIHGPPYAVGSLMSRAIGSGMSWANDAEQRKAVETIQGITETSICDGCKRPILGMPIKVVATLGSGGYTAVNIGIKFYHPECLERTTLAKVVARDNL